MYDISGMQSLNNKGFQDYVLFIREGNKLKIKFNLEEIKEMLLVLGIHDLEWNERFKQEG